MAKQGLYVGRSIVPYLAEGWGRFHRRFLFGWTSLVGFRGATPDRLLLAPIDLRTPDIFIASEIISGRFPLAGQVFDALDQNPFSLELSDLEFAKELHGFRWLRHLRASDDPRAEETARYLTNEWIIHYSKKTVGPSWELGTVSKRLISWLSHSPIMLTNADHGFYRRFMTSIGKQVRFLQYAVAGHDDPAAQLHARTAIAMASLCLPSTNSSVRSAAMALDVELERQILPDGGHISRNPEIVLKILADLLPLRQTYINLGSALPVNMLPSMDRMFMALRFFRHSNGEIALFNGSGYESANYLMSILQNDETNAQNPFRLPQSGFNRLEADKSVLLMDAGMPPPGRLSNRAHAGCLSFEFSCGPNRLIVNAGSPEYGNKKYRELARLTAAHSTMIVEDTSSARVSNSSYLGSVFTHGPREVEVTDITDDDFYGVNASHDGYIKDFGVVHQRQVRLSKDGNILAGFDMVEGVPAKGINIAIRFHIHPSVKLGLLRDGSILLTAGNGTRWVFSASIKPTVEADIFFADLLGLRKSHQIALLFNADEHRRISWMLKAVDRS